MKTKWWWKRILQILILFVVVCVSPLYAKQIQHHATTDRKTYTIKGCVWISTIKTSHGASVYIREPIQEVAH